MGYLLINLSDVRRKKKRPTAVLSAAEGNAKEQQCAGYYRVLGGSLEMKKISNESATQTHTKTRSKS